MLQNVQLHVTVCAVQVNFVLTIFIYCRNTYIKISVPENMCIKVRNSTRTPPYYIPYYDVPTGHE